MSLVSERTTTPSLSQAVGGDASKKTQLRVDSQKIEAEARSALQECSYAAVRGVKCVYRDGAVTLTGRVSSYYLKQVAQTEVRRRLDDAAAIRNHVEVAPFEPRREN